MVSIMNEENDLDHNVEGDPVKGPVDCVCRDEVVQAFNEIRNVKAPVPSDVSLELIAGSVEVQIQVMFELCQRVPDGFGMSAEWVLVYGSKHSGSSFQAEG